MGGDDAQKLLPWRGMTLLSGAQQTSGSLQNHHSSAVPIASRQTSSSVRNLEILKYPPSLWLFRNV